MNIALARTLLVLLCVGLLPVAGAATRNDTDTARARFERDRQSILAMAGTFKVTFDMRETVPFVADYVLLPARTSGGHEVVKVVEDSGTRINLQHLLVVAGDEGAPVVVKHWRQTWAFEPDAVLTYTSAGRWDLRAVPAAERVGAWSQVVWQTDDSPRYGGVGRWSYDAGVTRWTSAPTLRPLARRDAVRHPVYNRYLGTNRHALTPTGWVHEQDNAKLGERDGHTLTFVDEVVVNTYVRDVDFDVAAADRYWERTAGYWAAVRDDWDSAIRRQRGVGVPEEAENGSQTGPRLMKLAERIVDGEMDAAAATAAARDEIATTAAAARSQGGGS
jgi:hypothetical protein